MNLSPYCGARRLAVNVSAVLGLAADMQALHDQRVPPAVVQRAFINREPHHGATWATPDSSSHDEQALCILNQKV